MLLGYVYVWLRGEKINWARKPPTIAGVCASSCNLDPCGVRSTRTPYQRVVGHLVDWRHGLNRHPFVCARWTSRIDTHSPPVSPLLPARRAVGGEPDPGVSHLQPERAVVGASAPQPPLAFVTTQRWCVVVLVFVCCQSSAECCCCCCCYCCGTLWLLYPGNDTSVRDRQARWFFGGHGRRADMSAHLAEIIVGCTLCSVVCCNYGTQKGWGESCEKLVPPLSLNAKSGDLSAFW